MEYDMRGFLNKAELYVLFIAFLFLIVLVVYKRSPAEEPRDENTKQFYLVIFDAKWCGPCRQLNRQILKTPRLNNVQRTLEQVKKYYAFDVDKYPEKAKAWRVDAVPTSIIVYGNGKESEELGRMEGYLDRTTYIAWINESVKKLKR